MCATETFVWAAFCVVFGPPAALWPHRLARFEEVLDAIGRRPAGPVEPAEWKVSLTRLAGVGMTLVGAALGAVCLA